MIYQAASAHALGRGWASTQIWLPDGQVMSRRALQKIRAGEPGGAAAERLLVGHGARPRRAGEDPRTWLAEALVAAGTRRIRHPGCWRYGFPLDQRVEMAPARTPYPCPCTACRARGQAACN